MKLFFIYLCLIVSIFCFGQQVNFNSGSAAVKTYRATVPYTEKNSLMLVPVVIHEKQYLFLLDTGAMTAVTQQVANAHKLNQLPPVEVSDSGANKSQLDVVTIDELKFGNVPFHYIPAVVINKSLFMECLGIDGIIGSNLLRGSAVRFSSKTKTVTLSDKIKNFELDKKSAIDIELDEKQGNPYLWVNFNNGAIDAREEVLFDTGMTGFYNLSVGVYQKHFKDMRIFSELYSAKGTYSLGIHGNAATTMQYKVTIPEFRAGKQAFRNVTANTTATGGSRIGASILRYGDVTIDYKNKKIYFEPYQNEIIDKAQKSWPFEPVVQDRKLAVGIVWDPAQAEKVKVGDQILTFHDTNYNTDDVCALKAIEIPNTIDTVRLVLKDADTGEIKEVQITRK